MEVAGVLFGVKVSGEEPPGTGWTGPGAGWRPQSWQTACGETAISWMTTTAKESSPVFHPRSALSLLALFIFLFGALLPAPGSLFLSPTMLFMHCAHL